VECPPRGGGTRALDVTDEASAGQAAKWIESEFGALDMYAKELRDTPVKVNAANPGYCATDLNGHSGFRTPEQGAQVSVHLATLAADGPSGVLWGHLWTTDGPEASGVLPW